MSAPAISSSAESGSAPAQDAVSLFRRDFQALTGHLPLSWQERLFQNYFAKSELPSVIDLPTGLGKTMIIAIWLIARSRPGSTLPRRLIYVVDRRTVVDQATDIAEEFAFLLASEDSKKFDGILARKPHLGEQKRKFAGTLRDLRDGLGVAGTELALSTLRGQLADNREWSQDPSKPAIIIGTVDLIGSGLLFSGYRSSFKRRPLEAGLLGQDSLLVLDEAHLSKPFEKLIASISRFQKAHGNPMCVIRMSATTTEGLDTDRFTLEDADMTPLVPDGDGALVANPVVVRFEAKKTLTIIPLGEKEELPEKLADDAIDLAQNNALRGKRIVAFVRRPDDAKAVAEAIRGHVVESVDESGPKAKKIKNTPYAESVAVLTGTMRGLERDELVHKPLLKRFLNGNEDPDLEDNKKPVFLVSTSAGEVGFDLNADHMVCDTTSIDSFIQRLGRVNRRGMGDAQVHLFVELPKKGKDDKPKKLEGPELAIGNTLVLLQGVTDVSPKNIAHLKRKDWSTIPDEEQGKDRPKSRYDLACWPVPTMVELTDVLVDAWSMTSITERMPGRPEVGPWLRGVDDELPQTTVAWRAEVGLVNDHPDPATALQRIFSKHPVRPHEAITTNSDRVAEFLKEACKLKDRPHELPNTRIALRLSRGKIALRTIKELVADPRILNAEPTLILPATCGGLDAAGMLDVEAIPKTPKVDDPLPPSLDVADHPEYKQREDASPRFRLLIRRTDDGTWIPESVPGAIAIAERLELEATYPTSTALFAGIRKSKPDLRVRLVQPVKVDEEGDAVSSLVMLTPVSNRSKSPDQTLDEHVGAVEEQARRIADALELAEHDLLRVALLFAARWHDEGKKAEVWQRFVCGPDADGRYKGKSSKTRDPKSLGGYRHEFGSLLRLLHPDRHKTACDLPADVDTRQLALHLIATHHGFGRPHFAIAVARDFRSVDCDSVHTESIRRFARLQRKYGWWRLAWLENLLRCADALASADDVSEDDVGDANEEGAKDS